MLSERFDEIDEVERSSTEGCELLTVVTVVTLLLTLIAVSGLVPRLFNVCVNASGVISFSLVVETPTAETGSGSSTSVLLASVSTPLKSERPS